MEERGYIRSVRRECIHAKVTRHSVRESFLWETSAHSAGRDVASKAMDRMSGEDVVHILELDVLWDVVERAKLNWITGHSQRCVYCGCQARLVDRTSHETSGDLLREIGVLA